MILYTAAPLPLHSRSRSQYVWRTAPRPTYNMAAGLQHTLAVLRDKCERYEDAGQHEIAVLADVFVCVGKD